MAGYSACLTSFTSSIRFSLHAYEVSDRLGVSAHSLYKWLRAIKPDNSEQHARDLLEAKSEILKLRAQLKRTEEERDILKKAARYFAREPD